LDKLLVDQALDGDAAVRGEWLSGFSLVHLRVLTVQGVEF
jgi:hypothetical protein